MSSKKRGLGRGLEYYDQCTVKDIEAAAKRDGHKFSSVVLAIVRSDPFQKRRLLRPDEVRDTSGNLHPGGVVADPTLFDHLYTHAWFVTFALSFLTQQACHTARESPPAQGAGRRTGRAGRAAD